MRSSRMQRLDRLTADARTLFVAELGKGVRSFAVGPPGTIRADDHALRCTIAVRRINHVLVQPVGPREAAEYIVVALPEAWRFERELHAAQILWCAQNRGFLGRRKIARNLGEDRQRQCADAVIGLGHLAARAML